MKLLPSLRGVFLALTLVAVAVQAADFQKVTDKKLFNGEVIKEYRLANGLRVLLLSRHQAQVLTYQVWFKVGSVNEKLDPKLNKTGLAHLFEHMMFRGTKKFADGEFDKITAAMGAENQNASTYFYRTNYYESIPSKHLERLVELEADRMANLILDKQILEKEKGAVVGELRRGLDSPNRMAWEKLMEVANPTTAYRIPAIGSEAEIKGFTVEEGEYFYRTFYAPNNATVIVIGDTTEEKLLPLLVKYYGGMKSQAIPQTPVPLEPFPTKEKRVTATHKQATSEILMVAYPIPPITSDEIVPLSLLSTHLGVGMEAPLRKKLVDTGLAVNVNASTGSQPNLFQIMVQMVEGKSSDLAIRVIDQEMASISKKPIDKDAFTRAVNQDKLNMYGDISNSSALGNWLGEYLTLCDDYTRGFELLERLNKITPADLTKVTKAYMLPSRRSILVMKPGGKKK